ncbi:MAG: DNA repair protein RecO [Rikenellaceae bacterium]
MSAQKFYKGRGIVLHTIKYGESAMIVHILTDTMGRQCYMVRGIRSKRGRGSKAALFQPLFTVEFEAEMPRRSSSDLHHFKEVRSALVLGKTPFDIRRSTIALFIAEMLYRLVQESEVNLDLFDFAWNAVESLDKIEDGLAVANFHLWFMANLSRELGYLPDDEYRSGFWFDIVEGKHSQNRPSSNHYLTPKVSEIFSQLLECNIENLARIELGRESRVEVLEGLISYYGYHLGAVHNVQSIKILKDIF